MTFKDLATDALTRGFSVIPLQPRSKEPMPGFGATHASKDPAIVMAWADQFPDSNIGIVADADTIILDVDDVAAWEQFQVDPRGLGNPRDVLKLKRPPKTFTVESSPSKAHYYYRRPTGSGEDAYNLSLGELGSLRADNQYVVGPGSIHPRTGEPYKIIDDSRVAIAPYDWIVNLELVAQHLKRGRSLVIKNWDGKTKIPEGGRHATLMSEIGKRWDGEIDEADLFAHAETLRDKHCEPGARRITDGELRSMVGWARDQEPNEKPPVLLKNGTPVTAVESAEPEEEWELIRYSSKTAKAIRYIWPGVLAAGKITTLNGEPGCGKSLITLDIAARITTGRDWPDGSKNELPPSDVLLLTHEEDPEDTILPRFQIAGGNPDRLLELRINGGDGVMKIEVNLDRLERRIQKNPDTKLIILDPLLDFTKAKQCMDEEVRPALNALNKMIQRLRLAAIGVNHLNKKTDLSAQHRVSGSRAWTAVPRFNFMVGKGGDPALRHMISLKCNLTADDTPSWDFSVKKVQLAIPDGLELSVMTEQPQVVWQGRGAGTLESLQEAQQTKSEQGKETKTLKAIAWLRSYMNPLRGGWVPSQTVKAEARKAGVGKDALKRAFGELEIESRKMGTTGNSEWRLTGLTVKMTAVQ